MYTRRSLILETACERAVPIVGPFRKGAEPWPCSPLAGGPTRRPPGGQVQGQRGGDSWSSGPCAFSTSPLGPWARPSPPEGRGWCHFKGATETAMVTAAWSAGNRLAVTLSDECAGVSQVVLALVLTPRTPGGSRSFTAQAAAGQVPTARQQAGRRALPVLDVEHCGVLVVVVLLVQRRHLHALGWRGDDVILACLLEPPAGPWQPAICRPTALLLGDADVYFRHGS